VFQDNDDSGNRIELRSHQENSKVVVDDNVDKDKKNDDAKEMKDDNDDHADNT
nr:hypothetical protein [Tanacetum cinerariifolium]